ncbi:MAG TPA: hypothetical protein VG488_02975 [Candidatus Angelobacter sp.]|jgi:hypothetical protein|nr:hypothetical protein [Candidatus Angelobacter sp.]
MKHCRVVLIIAVVFQAMTFLSGQALATTHWTVVSSPNASANDNVLAAVAANSASDVWAVGQFLPDATPNTTNTLIEHFDGTSWSIVPSPNVGTHANALFAVTAKSGKAWAVGYFIDDNFNSRSLIEAWDGQKWNIINHPHAGSSDQFFGVSAISPADIWAVGLQRDSSGKFLTLTEHFDGTDWSVVSSPNPGTTGNQLLAVVSISSKSVWAVGQQLGNNGPDRALIEHWNGSSWSVVSSPADGVFSTELYGVAGVSDDDVRAVGDKQDNIHNPRTLAVNGDNGSFRLQSAANMGTGENHLYGLAAVSNDLAFAVGDVLDPTTGNFNNLVESCGDSGCVQETTPNPSQAGNNQLGGVAVVNAGDVWAVGMFDGLNAPQTLILHRTQ